MLLTWIRSTAAEFAWRRDNRVLISLVYCNCMAALGLAIASLGPALLSLAEQTDSTLTATGYCFGARSVGYLLGSFGGPLFDKIPGHRALACGLLLAGIGGACIPAAQSVYALGATVSLQGCAMGFLDTGANVLLIYQYGQHVGPWMQFLHASFAIGAFLAPMLLRACVRHDSEHSSESASYDLAFLIIGAYSIAIALTLLVLKSPVSRKAQMDAASKQTEAPTQNLATSAELNEVDLGTLDSTEISTNSSTSPAGNRAESTGKPALAPSTALTVTTATAATTDDSTVILAENSAKLRKTKRWIVVLTTAALLGVYVGCEAGYGSFVTAFSVVALDTSEAEGQLLAGAYWGAIMVGRLLAVPISLYIKPDRYLIISMSGCVGSCVLLLLGQSSVAMVWVATLLYGLSMACVFPTAIALAESYFPVDGGDTTAFVVGAATGEWLLPFIIATLFGNVPGDSEIPAKTDGPVVGPVIVLWVVLIGCAVNLAILFWLIRKGEELKRLTTTSPQAAPAEAHLQGPHTILNPA